MWRLWILCVFFLVLLVLWVWCVCVGASFCSFVVSESLLHYHDEAVMVAATLLIQKTTRGVSFRSPTRTKIDMFCLRHFSRFSCHALFARDSDCFLASQNMLENDLTFEFYDGHACQTKNTHASTPTPRASQPVSQPTSQLASQPAHSIHRFIFEKKPKNFQKNNHFVKIWCPEIGSWAKSKPVTWPSSEKYTFFDIFSSPLIKFI